MEEKYAYLMGSRLEIAYVGAGSAGGVIGDRHRSLALLLL